MDIERIAAARRRAEAPPRISKLPVPIARPHLMIESHGRPIAVGGSPIDVALSVRNIGDEDCYITAIACSPGATVAPASADMILRARGRAHTLPLVFDPFALPQATGRAAVQLSYRSLTREQIHVLEVVLDYEREVAWREAPLISEPEIRVEVPLLGLHRFEINEPSATTAVLHIEEGPGAPGQYPMRKTASGRFEVAVALQGAAHYAYRFRVDGAFHLDERVDDQQGVAGVDTPCTPLDMADYATHTLHIRNPTSKVLPVKVSCSERWLRAQPAAIKLAPDAVGELRVQLKTGDLSVGEHSASVTLTWEDASGRRERALPVRMTLRAPGPVPTIDQTLNVGTVYVGSNAKKTLKVCNIGSGALDVRLVSPDASIHAEPAVVPSASGAEVTVIVTPTGPPPARGEDKIVRVVIESNTPVATLRSYPIEIRYRLEPMQLVPYRLDFGGVSAGTAHERSVEARHGSTAVAVTVIGAPPPWLTASAQRDKKLIVRLDGEKWTGASDEAFDVVLSLQDPNTKSIGALHVTGEWQRPAIEVTPSTLRFGQVSKGKQASLTLAIRNARQGELVVKDVVLDHHWVSANAGAARSDGEGELIVSVNATGLKPGRHHAQIEIMSNDPVRPRLEIPLDVRVTE